MVNADLPHGFHSVYSLCFRYQSRTKQYPLVSQNHFACVASAALILCLEVHLSLGCCHVWLICIKTFQCICECLQTCMCVWLCWLLICTAHLFAVSLHFYTCFGHLISFKDMQFSSPQGKTNIKVVLVNLAHFGSSGAFGYAWGTFLFFLKLYCRLSLVMMQLHV